MPRSNSMVVMMLLMMVASFQSHSTVAQTRHIVGGALGWTVPPDGASSYTLWASEQTFNVGDTLVFNFTSGAHNVAEVSQDAYGPCTMANPMPTMTKGPATLTLLTSGKHFYVCSVGTHCRMGQKLTIYVAPRMATGQAPVGGPMPSSPTTPLPSSGSRTFAAEVAFVFIAAGLAFYFGY